MIETRKATIEDLNDIMHVENTCFFTPWPRSCLFEEIEEKPWSRVFVAVYKDQIIGFIIYWMVDTERHLLNLATLPKYRKKGAALKMMNHMIEESNATDASLIVLEVRKSNTGAQKLYSKLGFEEVGQRRKYYKDNGEDAIIMMLDL